MATKLYRNQGRTRSAYPSTKRVGYYDMESDLNSLEGEVAITVHSNTLRSGFPSPAEVQRFVSGE